MVKRPRVQEFSRGTYVSHRALESLLLKAREEGIPCAVSRTTQWRERRTSVSVETSYGPLVVPVEVPQVDGDGEPTDPIQIYVQHPLAMLQHSCRGPFQKMMQATLAKHPEPWSLILYSDEVGESDQVVDSRKACCDKLKPPHIPPHPHPQRRGYAFFPGPRPLNPRPVGSTGAGWGEVPGM